MNFIRGVAAIIMAAIGLVIFAMMAYAGLYILAFMLGVWKR